MIRYLRKKKGRLKRELPDSIYVTFENQRARSVVARAEDDGFDYMNTVTIPSGARQGDYIPKGTHICIWEANEIVGEYVIKQDRDDDIDIIIM